MKKGRLIIIAAPSGGGKTSVIERLMTDHPDMVHSISCTTRGMRRYEKDGEYYHHIDRKTFEEGIRAGKFAEWANVHNNFYGTPKAPIDKWLTEGKDVLLDLDVVGSLNLKKLYKDRSISFFLLPPSMDILQKRLAGRGTDSREVQELRLKNAMTEMTFKDNFDHQIVNDILEKTCEEIEQILCI